MAQIDTSISDMPWLGAMDRGALARGVQSGATIANVRNQRAALAQRKFEFEREQMMREAQERRAQALLPLQQTVMDQERRMNELKITTALESRQDYLNNESDLLRLNKDIARAFTETDNGYANSLVMMREALAKNPRLVTDPRFVEQRKMLDEAIRMETDLSVAQSRLEQYQKTSTPEITTVTNPLTGKEVAYGRTGPNSFERIPDKATAQTLADKQAVNQLQKQADILTREWLKLDPSVEGNKTKRIKLAFQVGKIQKRIGAILGTDEGSDQPTPPATEPTPTTEQQPGPTKRLQWTPEGLIPAQ